MMEHGIALEPGVRIEEFEVVRELGAGGFGITYLARDLQLDRPVAIKEYLPQDWGTRRFDGTIGPRSASVAGDYQWGLNRFLEEARVLARLSHPHIVQVYRVIEARGTAYLAMEYIEGRSLADQLRVVGRLPEARVRPMLEGLAEGLAEVHRADLLHRDIKPANVMLRGHDGSPVLIDFGAARQQIGRQSRSLTAVLTPGYAPIEQYSSRGRQGPWTDIYALGAMAYAALSGRPPDEAIERVREDAMPPVTEVAPEVSGSLAAAVDAALAVDERARPQDIGEWRRMLEVRASAPPIRPPPPPPPPPAEVPKRGLVLGKRRRSWAKQGRWWRVSIAGAAILAAGGLWLLAARSGSMVEADPPDVTVDPAVEEAALGLVRRDRIMVQWGLSLAGHYAGQRDGVFGGDTRDALRAWQLAGGIEPTGYLTPVVSAALRDAGSEAVGQDSITGARRVAEAEARRVTDSIAEARRVTDSIAEARRVTDSIAEARRVADSIAELRRPGRVFSDCARCPALVVVGPGRFMMGSPLSEAGRFDSEGPRHAVTIGYPLGVGVYEVTFTEWDACVSGGGCGRYPPDDEGWGRARRPVINVSWEDAQAYVAWLSVVTGEEYRLLSEAEWEYVARAGTQTARHWGQREGDQCRFSNGRDQTAPCADGFEYTAPVGSYRADGFGLHDVLGNVWEWTADCWNGSYSGAPTDGSPWATGDCSRRVLRGGSWYNEPHYLRSAFRNRSLAGNRANYYGFRVARTMK